MINEKVNWSVTEVLLNKIFDLHQFLRELIVSSKAACARAESFLRMTSRMEWSGPASNRGGTCMLAACR